MGKVNGEQVEGRLEGVGGSSQLGGWCNKVNARGWLASKLGASKEKEKMKKKVDSRT